jgi:hypothetical protein
VEQIGYSRVDKAIKKEVELLLIKRDFDSLLELCKKDRRFWQQIRFRLYDLNDEVRWPAIEMAGKVMQQWWQAGKEEKVKNYIRTLFWSLTDESGGIGWSAPQTIAEIIAHIPQLIDPYASMMIAHTIEEPPLIKGCLWGIGRLGEKITDSVFFFEDKVLAVFQTDDTETLGLAAWAMGEARFHPACSFIERLSGMQEKVVIYGKGIFLEKSLEKWAKDAITKIKE